MYLYINIGIIVRICVGINKALYQKLSSKHKLLRITCSIIILQVFLYTTVHGVLRAHRQHTQHFTSPSG